MKRPQKQQHNEAAPSTSGGQSEIQEEIQEAPAGSSHQLQKAEACDQPRRQARNKRRRLPRLPWELTLALAITLVLGGFLLWYTQEEEPHKVRERSIM